MSQAIAQRACAKLRSAIADEAVVRLNFTGDLREMLDALEYLQPMVEKDEMQDTFYRIFPPGWLQLARDAAYRIMDMVDELRDTTAPAAATMTRMLPRLAIKRNHMATKVELIKKQVTELKKIYGSYISEEDHVITQKKQQLMDKRLTGPLFEEASVFGRGADKQRIVTVLLSAASNITQAPPSCIILPIFGLPGSGKTTLAQMVFNDNTHSLQEYNFRAWVYVSPKLDFRAICGSILCEVMSGGGEKEEIDGHAFNADVVGIDRIMKRLHELLNDKKALLVLDEIWEEDSIQLHLLKSMLTFLGDKVDVIVTTCNQAIARKICTVVQPYRLNPLGDDTCWEIIKKSICFEEDAELEKIGRQIASKCRGVPPVALKYASMLVGSQDPKDWEKIMERNVWYHTSLRSSPLIQTLFLCYKSMPPELRLCFDYYSDIFPNGHNIVKDDLVHQWIALDFIQPSERLSATEIAEGYIARLLEMSFFQTAKEQASGNDDKCPAMFTMHDLAHGFTNCMSQESGPCMPYKLLTNCRGKLDDRYGDLRALRCVGCSEVEFDDGSFSSKKYLHVLELKESSVPKLPDSIWQLRHLGYLKISEFSGLVALPGSFGDLHNLFHIDLSGCSGLINLPESFGKLIRLVHVNLSGCSALVTLPESFGNLTSLVHINLSGCYGLVMLPESFGKLISLVHVNLSGCSGLLTLTDTFGRLISLMHVNLSGCSGLVTLPSSVGRLIKLFHIDLSGCSRLIKLPESFGKLTLLVHVNLSGCSGLATLPESFGDLMNLSHLNLSSCHALAELPEQLQKLGKLIHLDLSFWSCFEEIGKGLGGLTKLEHLNLSHPCCHLAQQRSNLQGLKDGLCKLTSLRYLNLSMCLNPIFYYKSEEENVQYIESCVSSLSSLEHLDLSHNTFLFDLPKSLGGLNRLHTLDLSGCIRLKRIGEMKYVKFIALRKCRGLESCHFVVHVDDDAPYSSSNIVQLEDVNCQELQISCLEKVRSTEEAQRIKLVEKQKLEKLKLSWTLESIRSVKDSALLGELVPPPNLQCLEVNGYNGTCLPGYLGDLTSLQELKIVCCKQLNSLPDSIKELTNLKDLYISGCQPLETWCQLEENKKMLEHIPNKNYEEHGSTSRPEINENGRSIAEVEEA